MAPRTHAPLPPALLGLGELTETDAGHTPGSTGPVLATPAAVVAGIALGLAVADAISVLRPQN